MPEAPDVAWRGMVAGRNDDEILALCRAFGGVQPLTQVILEGVAAAAHDALRAAPVVVAYNIRAADERYEHTLRLGGPAPALDVEPVDSAEATFSLSLPDLVRLVAGVLDMIEALADGRVLITGDQDAARRMLMALADG